MLAKKNTDTTYHTGMIQILRSGESGKCWSPPVTDPIPTASMAPASRVLQVLFVSSSIIVPIMKHTIPNIPVTRERVPEKNPCEMAPVMKLIPIYLIRVEK